MKDYVNLLFSIIDKIDKWETNDNNQKIEIIKIYIDDLKDSENFINYFDKYRIF